MLGPRKIACCIRVVTLRSLGNSEDHGCDPTILEAQFDTQVGNLSPDNAHTDLTLARCPSMLTIATYNRT